MNWKETVIPRLGRNTLDAKHDQAIRQAQAELSFKAGQREVIEWLGRHSDILEYINTDHEDEWQAKLKEWEIE